MKINDLFEHNVINKVSILKSIYENNGIVNLKRISVETLMDVKTVNNLYTEILEKNNGVLDLRDMSGYHSMRIDILKESWVYQLCENILLGNEVSFIDFMENNFLSESKFRRKIKHINTFLETVSLKIISRKGYLYLKGREVQIRFLAQQFFWGVYKGIEWPFEDIDFNSMFSFFKKIVFIDLEPKVKDVVHMEFCYSFAILLIRRRNGYNIKKSDLPQFMLNNLASFYSEKVIEVEEVLKSEYKLENEERTYFLLLMLMRPEHYLNESFFEQSMKIHEENNTDIYIVYNKLMTFLDSKALHKNGRKFAEAIIISALVSIETVQGFYRPITNYEMENFFNSMAPNLLPNMMKLIESVKLEYPDITILKEKDYLAIRLAESYSLVCNMLDFERRILVGIITDLSTSLEELMVRKLQNRFYLINNVEFVTINQEKYEKYDIVLKTSITLGDMSKVGEEVLIIQPDLNRKDIAEIANIINAVRRK